jgi:quercetin dioxygenase-like cupin family protein
MHLHELRPTRVGAVEMFVGDVYIDEITDRDVPSRLRVNTVRFSPGARTAWHCHALGQTLRITEGLGRV